MLPLSVRMTFESYNVRFEAGQSKETCANSFTSDEKINSTSFELPSQYHLLRQFYGASHVVMADLKEPMICAAIPKKAVKPFAFYVSLIREFMMKFQRMPKPDETVSNVVGDTLPVGWLKKVFDRKITHMLPKKDNDMLESLPYWSWAYGCEKPSNTVIEKTISELSEFVCLYNRCPIWEDVIGGLMSANTFVTLDKLRDMRRTKLLPQKFKKILGDINHWAW